MWKRQHKSTMPTIRKTYFAIKMLLYAVLWCSNAHIDDYGYETSKLNLKKQGRLALRGQHFLIICLNDNNKGSRFLNYLKTLVFMWQWLFPYLLNKYVIRIYFIQYVSQWIFTGISEISAVEDVKIWISLKWRFSFFKKSNALLYLIKYF